VVWQVAGDPLVRGMLAKGVVVGLAGFEPATNRL
jgi:hypothetical protein